MKTGIFGISVYAALGPAWSENHRCLRGLDEPREGIAAGLAVKPLRMQDLTGL